MDPFNGIDDASAWLKRFDERFKKKTSSYKLKKFGNLVEGECRLWWDRLGDAGNEWAATREAFKAYWIDGLQGDALTVKCRDITSSSPVSVNTVTAAPTPPPVTKPEPSEAHPMFSVLVSTSIIDPRGIYAKAFAEFSRATDQEAMFRVIWDAAFEAGKQCGVLKGRGEVRAESIEEGRQLGLAIAKQAAEREKELQEARTTTSVSIDTTGLTPEPEHEHEPEPDHHIPPISSEPSAEPATVLSPLNWADDADTIPATTLIPPSSSPTRDLTVLRSKSASRQPFSSLQRHATRSSRLDKHHFPRHTIKPTNIRSTRHLKLNHSTPLIIRRHPSGIGPGKPVQTISQPYRSSSGSLPPLDWDRDPRLVQLGRILGDLGWVRH